MKIKNILLSWVAALVLICGTNSCKVLDSADKHFEYFEYAKAIPQYEKFLKRDSLNAAVWARLGDCYRLNNQTKEAEACYKKAVENPNTKSIYGLYYAQMMVSNGKYSEAQAWMDEQMKSGPADSREVTLQSGLHHISDFYVDKDKYKVEKININSGESEYGPVFYKDGIIFTSSRESEAWADRKHGWTGENYYSLYYAKGKELNFESPVVFLKGVQTKYNNSSVCFNKNGTEMILTRNNIENGKVKTSSDRVVKLKLFICTLRDGAWSDVVPFQYNSDQYSCAHPALSPDGTKLYFASDMPGSIGGMDLWECDRTPGGWGQPQNLGAVVNTKGNEIFPTIADDGTIYFSANEREGLGGLDIYSTKETSGSYSEPKNAGAPINSPDDDFGLIWDAANKSGYVTSNRVQQGKNDDIFYVTRNTVVLSGLVYDKATGNPLDQSTVRIVEEDSVIGHPKTNATGNFASALHLNKNYLLIAERENYKTDTLKLTSAEIAAAGDTVFAKIPLQRNELLISLEGRIFNLTTGDPVDSARVMLINLTCHDTLMMTTGVDGLYAFSRLDSGYQYQVVADAKYCLPNSADTNTIGIHEDAKLRLDVGLYCLSDVMVLRNIYYDLDKYNIRPDAAKELDKLVEILKKYPQIKIELGSHTDCRASKAYNMRLSQNRAKSAVAYLVQRGINPKRMTAQGYGESVLVNKCECEGDRKVECTEEEHQLNRRTEIKILSWNWVAVSSL